MDKQIIINEEELSDVKTKHHTPEGLFTGNASEIVDGLLKDANGDEELALKRINFYINRAGDGLSNKAAVHTAKKQLQKKLENKMENMKNLKFHKMIEETLNNLDVAPKYTVVYSTWEGYNGDDKEVVDAFYSNDLEKAKEVAKKLSIERNSLVDVIDYKSNENVARFIKGEETDLHNQPLEK